MVMRWGIQRIPFQRIVIDNAKIRVIYCKYKSIRYEIRNKIIPQAAHEVVSELPFAYAELR